MSWKETFEELFDCIRAHQLKQSILKTENVVFTRPSRYNSEALNSVKNDYRLMADYWLRGFNDPQRKQVYDQLLRRIYSVVADMMMTECHEELPIISAAFRNTLHARNDWSVQTIRYELENYVSDVAMLELTPEHKRIEETRRLHTSHQQLLNALFCHIVSSGQWSDSLGKAYEHILLSPTIDTLDQQVIVSAVTLSLYTVFDFQKYRLLTTVYKQSVDEYVRQRALIGWVFATSEKHVAVYPEIAAIVEDICQDEQNCAELTELQMQLLLCMQAEDDGRMIQKEIMPDLIKGNNLRITQNGIQEIEEDTLENILHPDNAEKKIEQMEENMQRMIEMQKRGSDIYFGGFSQMKRFPFFNETAHWFMPFTSHHPAISETWQNAHGRKLLHTLMAVGAFCDSDKYSFALAFDLITNRLPKNIFDMIDKGEADAMPLGGEVAIEEQRKPAYIRRSYLQNLYRFYRLHPQRSGLFSPFETDTFLFSACGLFSPTGLNAHFIEIAHFLTKYRFERQALLLLSRVDASHRDLNYHLLSGHLLMKEKRIHEATGHYRDALRLSPQHEKALMGMARCLFAEGDYDSALQAYQKVIAIQEEKQQTNHAVLLNAAVCMINLNDNEGAQKLLYKLNYEHPNDDNVTRVLAWSLTSDGKYEQATRLYHKLIDELQQESEKLNYGYCLWLSGDKVSAVSVLRQFLSLPDNKEFNLRKEFLVTEHDFLLAHGIDDDEIMLMLEELLY